MSVIYSMSQLSSKINVGLNCGFATSPEYGAVCCGAAPRGDGGSDWDSARHRLPPVSLPSGQGGHIPWVSPLPNAVCVPSFFSILHCGLYGDKTPPHAVSDPTQSDPTHLLSCAGGRVEALWSLLFCCTATRLKSDRLRRINPLTFLCGLLGLAMIWPLLCNLRIIKVKEAMPAYTGGTEQSQDF